MMSLLLSFGVLFILFLFSAFFSAAETAIFSLTKIDKKQIAKERFSIFSKLILYHLEHPRQTLATILIANLIVNTLLAAIVTLLIFESLGPSYIGVGVSIFTVLLIFFGEILPKTFAVKNNQKLARAFAFPLQIFVILLAPLRWLVRLAADKILGVFVRDKKEHSDNISQDEIKTLVKIGEEEGVLDSQERYMLQKLLELGERPVKNIMTPRTDLAALNIDDPREKNMEMIRKYHFSHFPVFQGTIDNLVGVVLVQEYVLQGEKSLQEVLMQPLYVPEVKRIDDLLAEFREKNQGFAVCLDEFGGTAGIATVEDILEEIFGEFYDEYAKVENPIRPLAHHEYIVEAKLALADFNEFFSMNLKAADATTVGGFILEKIGELPEKGRTVKFPECDFVIHEVIRQRRIRSVIVRPH